MNWHGPAVVLGAFVIDTTLGEPPNALHPVVWMGNVIGALRRRGVLGSRARQFVFGVLVSVFVPAIFSFGAAGLEWFARAHAHPGLVTLACVLMLKPMFALRALGEAGMRMHEALSAGDVAGAREGLRSLCSRDPSTLEPPALAAGAIESLAENASDSVVAPLFWFLVFGIPGAVFYRVVNTLDAMIGYHGKYEWFGKASARLDDAMNVIPARLTAALLLLAGLVSRTPGLSVRRGVRILLRDGAQTESPNSGRPMAAMAGLLGVVLEKENHYRLGDPERPLSASAIATCWRLVRTACWMAVLIAAGVSVRHGL